MAVSISINVIQNSQNVTNNTSNVTVEVKANWTGGSWNATGQCTGTVTIDGTKYSFSGITFNTGRTTSGSEVIMTKTVTISHKADGTKILSCSASFVTGVSSGTVTASASKTLTTIARKSTLTASNGTLGVTQNLAITRSSSSFTHTITYKCGSYTGTVAEKATGTSISFEPLMELANENKTGTSVSITFTLTTYSGSTKVGSTTKTISCAIPASVKPSCSVAVTDAMGYEATYGGFIKGLSKFKVNVTTTTAYGSAIASYSTTANGATYSASSFTTELLKTAGSLTVKTTVKDKRGRSGTASVSKTVLDYSAPSISSLNVRRCNADGTPNDQGEYVKVTFNATISNLNNKNSATYKIQYNKTSDAGNKTEVALTNYNGAYSVTDASYIFAADTGSSYEVKVFATDKFYTNTRTTNASTGFTLMHWLASGLGMAIGKVAELAGVLDIGFKTKFSGGILHPTIKSDTDLNDIIIPNTYVGLNVSSNNYGNCPFTSGTFTLEVLGAGDGVQILQRLTLCDKKIKRTFERFYYGSTWGEWICTSDFAGKLLWSGAYYMDASQTATLIENVSRQAHGIVLVFSPYASGAAIDYDFHSFFVPKYMVSQYAGKYHTFTIMSGLFSNISGKALFIHDDKIVGSDNNTKSDVSTKGITYNNKTYVLRYVIGV